MKSLIVVEVKAAHQTSPVAPFQYVPLAPEKPQQSSLHHLEHDEVHKQANLISGLDITVKVHSHSPFRHIPRIELAQQCRSRALDIAVRIS